MNAEDILIAFKHLPGSHDQASHGSWSVGKPAMPASDSSMNARDDQDDQDATELKRLQAFRYRTAMQEQQIEHIKKRLAADSKKWKVGQGVGWKAVRGQINRGFRIIKVDPKRKLATIRQVADTGLITTGGDYDRISDQTVHVADLVRDKKYDAKA